jgi:hypothetical protein
VALRVYQRVGGWIDLYRDQRDPVGLRLPISGLWAL